MSTTAAGGGVLDMALDDIIATNRKPRGGGAIRKRGQNSGRNHNQNNKPYQRPAQQQMASAALTQSKTIAPNTDKLVVSNLAQTVTEKDVRDLFSQIGPIKHASLNFDKNGRSKGVATVVFQKVGDANKAVKEYSGRTFDNRPMKIELILDASSAIFRLSPAVPVAHHPAKKQQQQQSGGVSKPVQQQQALSSVSGGKGRRNRPKKERTAPKTAEELDAEMDTYMNDQTMDDSAAALTNALA